MSYQAPSSLSGNAQQLAHELVLELRKLEEGARRQTMLELMLEPLYVAPDRPREGLVVVADGTSWNPGSGKGMYRYSGTGWVYVG